MTTSLWLPSAETVFLLVNGLPEKIDEYRKRWQAASELAEKNTISSIVKQDCAAYTWLLRHDTDWFYKNSPAPGRKGGNITINDYKEFDEELAGQVEKVVQKIYNISEKPKRISKTKITGELGLYESNLIKRKDKLPKTFASIDKYTESKHEWRIRKIKWAIRSSIGSQNLSSDWLILRKAGIRESLWSIYRPTVSQYIEASGIDKCS